MNRPFDCISEFIFVEHEPAKADVILVPGGSRPQLMEKAAELYSKGFASYILPSGNANQKIPDYTSEWEYLQSVGVSLGVPKEAILLEDQARNTFENANFSLKVLDESNLNYSKVILVCKAHHSRRALLTYQTAFPGDTEFIVCPITDERAIHKDDWFLDQSKIDIVMNEVTKIGQYFGGHIPDWANSH